MSKLHRDILKTIRPLLEPVNGRAEIKSSGTGTNPHFRLILYINNRTKEFPIASKPTNHTLLHKIRDVKKTIKELTECS